MAQLATICSKHDAIMKMAREIEDLANTISSLTDDAKDDGVAMEGGLEKKRDKIEELEKEIIELLKENAELKEEIKYLSRSI